MKFAGESPHAGPKFLKQQGANPGSFFFVQLQAVRTGRLARN
jgi:hypothetical protein